MILLYHRVSQVKEDPHQMIVSPENFRDQLAVLKESFNIVSLDKKIDQIKNGNLHESIAITFDDGYMDNYTIALPLLRDACVPATVFITVGAIVSQARFAWDTDRPHSRVLTLMQLYYLSMDQLIDIGSHTLSHVALSKLSTEQQYTEMYQSKGWLEHVLQRDVKYLSYPFGSLGDFTHQTMALAESTGYKAALANTQMNVGVNLYAMPRRIIRNWDIDTFRERIDTWRT